MKKVKSKEEIQKELDLYKSMYFATKKKLDILTTFMKRYDYLLPDDYRSIIKEAIMGVKWHV